MSSIKYIRNSNYSDINSDWASVAVPMNEVYKIASSFGDFLAETPNESGYLQDFQTGDILSVVNTSIFADFSDSSNALDFTGVISATFW